MHISKSGHHPLLRQISSVATLAALCGALACDNTPKGPPAPTPAERMAEVVAKIEELESRLTDLKSNVERFDSENWRGVVPDVRSDAERAADEIEELKMLALILEQELIEAERPDDYEPPDDPR